MTLEELSGYLHNKFPHDPDEVQQVLLDVMEGRETIRFPKTWAFRRVQWRKIDKWRQESRHESLDHEALRSLDTPLLRAQRRETIKRFVQGLTSSPRGGASRWKRWGYKEDLRELLQSDS